MYREALVSNGILFIETLLINDLSMRDLYFPHVGQFNHLGGNKNHLIISVDGKIEYMDSWERRIARIRKDTDNRHHSRKQETRHKTENK
ncbi:MAG: hypothetical protein Q9M89_02735 [Persephonella sp.]|nr:hypothetical protein [Persephonella sp.]